MWTIIKISKMKIFKIINSIMKTIVSTRFTNVKCVSFLSFFTNFRFQRLRRFLNAWKNFQRFANLLFSNSKKSRLLNRVNSSFFMFFFLNFNEKYQTKNFNFVFDSFFNSSTKALQKQMKTFKQKIAFQKTAKKTKTKTKQIEMKTQTKTKTKTTKQTTTTKIDFWKFWQTSTMRFVNEKKKMLMNDAIQTQKLNKKFKSIEKLNSNVFDNVKNVDKIIFNTRFFKTKFAFRKIISFNFSFEERLFISQRIVERIWRAKKKDQRLKNKISTNKQKVQKKKTK